MIMNASEVGSNIYLRYFLSTKTHFPTPIVCLMGRLGCLMPPFSVLVYLLFIALVVMTVSSLLSGLGHETVKAASHAVMLSIPKCSSYFLLQIFLWALSRRVPVLSWILSFNTSCPTRTIRVWCKKVGEWEQAQCMFPSYAWGWAWFVVQGWHGICQSIMICNSGIA